MLTKKDFKQLEEKFATKEDIINFNDEILREIRALHEELTMVVGYRDASEDNDLRITVVEKKSKHSYVVAGGVSGFGLVQEAKLQSG